MKTSVYNPSGLEVATAQAIVNLKDALQEQLPDGLKVVKVDNKISEDNPIVKLFVEDADGDPHEIVLKVIQLPDKF